MERQDCVSVQMLLVQWIMVDNPGSTAARAGIPTRLSVREERYIEP
jgi:hypothetical protein